ncbi:DNA adenine methylase [Caldifermentibacillus hisashii]|uniref:site-specific DNA-methyltransferase (adenine-specific) n=1 Tax=Caldifermentibacillus hisashii TaxID=996558 RepID=A0ABU9K308_9BACI
MAIKSPIKWVGGKSKLFNKLIPIFPEHKGYVEVFGGLAIMLLNKEPSKWEVLNDFDSNLMNFWSVVQKAHDQLIKSFEWEIVSREQFERYKEKYKNHNYDDAIERAKIFYYLVKAGFGADMKNPVFGTGKDRNRLRLEQVEEDIKLAHKRIQKVTIENKSFEDLFRMYDSEDTFFYLDPPYRKTKQYATGKFTDEQYELMRDCCKNAKGKWLITINNDGYIKELFKDYNIMDHEVFYSVCKTENGRTNFKELIITNYDI